MKIIGLTGGVACGKSWVAKRLEETGFPVIDTDALAHDLLKHDSRIKKSVRVQFGTTERKKLRETIFQDARRRKVLETILHPAIGKEVDKSISSMKNQENPPGHVIVVVPLLYESGWDKKVDLVLAVVSSEKNQLSRLKNRDGTGEALARQIIQAQLPVDEKARRANFVIQNNGSVEQLEQETRRFILSLGAP